MAYAQNLTTLVVSNACIDSLSAFVIFFFVSFLNGHVLLSLTREEKLKKVNLQGSFPQNSTTNLASKIVKCKQAIFRHFVELISSCQKMK